MHVTLAFQTFQFKESLTLSSKSPASSSGGMDLLVSVGVQAPTEIPRSGNKVMSK
jgi:hypothetical protein